MEVGVRSLLVAAQHARPWLEKSSSPRIVTLLSGGADFAMPSYHVIGIVKAAEMKSDFKFLYPLELPIKEKIETICREIYRADGVDYSPEAEAKIELYTKLGFDKLPMCMARPISFSTDAALKGNGIRVMIRIFRASAGVDSYPLLGEMRTMPGLPTRPSYYDIDLDLKTGKSAGLFLKTLSLSATCS
jgi:formyltetrahydrofolate synthetase